MTSNNFYAAPSYMSGGAFTIYSGARRHRGGSFLGSLGKILAPMGRTALSGMRTLAKNKAVRKLAKQALVKGVEVAGNVAVDALQGRDVDESIKRHAKQAALRTLAGPTPSARARTPSSPSKRFKQKNGKRRRQRRVSKAKPKRLTQAQRHRKELF